MYRWWINIIVKWRYKTRYSRHTLLAIKNGPFFFFPLLSKSLQLNLAITVHWHWILNIRWWLSGQLKVFNHKINAHFTIIWMFCLSWNRGCLHVSTDKIKMLIPRQWLGIDVLHPKSNKYPYIITFIKILIHILIWYDIFIVQ